MPRRLLALTLTLTLSLSLRADWPQFRGPNGAGIADPDTPVEWAKVPVKWKVPVGKGHSSPVVTGGQVFFQSASADGSVRTLHCLDAVTGAVKWTRDVPGLTAAFHQKNSLASSTPAVDGGRVFSLFWDGNACALHGYGTDGKPLWNISLGTFDSDHGAGTSPAAYHGKVFVNYDQGGGKLRPGKAEIMAFDAATGNKVWSAPRKGFRSNSSTPILRDLPGGKVELLVISTAGLTGYDPDTGRVNWDWTWKFNGMSLRTVGGALLADGKVFAFSGDGGGSRAAVAVAPGPTPKLVWEKTKATPYVPTCVVKGEHLYWVTDDGQAACVDLKTGNPLWNERVFAKGVTASLILAGDKVLAVAEDGKAIVFKATPTEFDKIADMDLGEQVFASPAAADGRLYVRGFEHLFCFAAK